MHPADAHRRLSFLLTDTSHRASAPQPQQPPPQEPVREEPPPQPPPPPPPPQPQQPQQPQQAEIPVQLYHYQPRPPSPPPAALPRRKGPSCFCGSLLCLAVAGCSVFLLLLILESPWISLEGPPSIRARREHALQLRRQQQLRGAGVPGVVTIGLWDEQGVVTPLQLTVAFAIASGVHETSINAREVGEHFFAVEVEGEGPWLVDVLHDPSFLFALNAQARAFGAKLVVSRSATERSAPVAPPATLATPALHPGSEPPLAVT